MTTDDLKRAEARYQRAEAKAEMARLERNAAIHEALIDGWSQKQIAETLDLSATRVWQLARAHGRRVFVAHEEAS
jgi:DNA-binding NarL/FixJ family response regulator